MSADPFIDWGMGSQGLNRYAYVGNRPLSFTDPRGFAGRCLITIGSDGVEECRVIDDPLPSLPPSWYSPWNPFVDLTSLLTGGLQITSENLQGKINERFSEQKIPKEDDECMSASSDVPTDPSILSVCPECYAMGAGRLAYAGLAKTIPSLAAAAEESLGAQAAFANAARNSLKDLFRGPLAPVLSGIRQPTFAESMAKYGGDAAKVIEAASRTNTAANAAGVTGVAMGAAAGHNKSKCKSGK